MNIKNIFNCFPLLSLLALMLTATTPVFAAGSGSSSEWEYIADIYMWAPQMDITTTSGQEVEIPFYQILNNLNFAAMTEFGARNDKWSILTDVIYMNLNQKNDPRSHTLPDGTEVSSTNNVKMKSWIVIPTVGYALLNSDAARVEVLGGLRYLWLNLGIEIEVEDEVVFDKSSTESFWDGIIGMRADINLNEKWYVPVYFDIGWGKSQSTWQASAGIGYHFSKFDAVLKYRYLDYEFDDDIVASDLVIKGPQLGAVFRF